MPAIPSEQARACFYFPNFFFAARASAARIKKKLDDKDVLDQLCKIKRKDDKFWGM